MNFESILVFLLIIGMMTIVTGMPTLEMTPESRKMEKTDKDVSIVNPSTPAVTTESPKIKKTEKDVPISVPADLAVNPQLTHTSNRQGRVFKPFQDSVPVSRGRFNL